MTPLPFEGPSFRAPEVLCGRPWFFAANSWKRLIFAPPLQTFTMRQTQVSGVGVVYVNGICLHTCDLSLRGCFDKDLASRGCFGNFFFVMRTFAYMLYMLFCHGLCGVYFEVHRFRLAHNFGEDTTGGCKAIQRSKNSEPKRSQQVSIEMNTADIDYSNESRRSERNVSPIYHSCLVPITVSTVALFGT